MPISRLTRDNGGIRHHSHDNLKPFKKGWLLKEVVWVPYELKQNRIIRREKRRKRIKNVSNTRYKIKEALLKACSPQNQLQSLNCRKHGDGQHFMVLSVNYPL